MVHGVHFVFVHISYLHSHKSTLRGHTGRKACFICNTMKDIHYQLTAHTSYLSTNLLLTTIGYLAPGSAC